MPAKKQTKKDYCPKALLGYLFISRQTDKWQWEIWNSGLSGGKQSSPTEVYSCVWKTMLRVIKKKKKLRNDKLHGYPFKRVEEKQNLELK